MRCQIPYGPGALELALPDEMVAGVLESSVEPSSGSEDDLVIAAMASPYGGKTLKELAEGKATCTIIISDHTRPVPSKHIIPFMLAELREGNPDIAITLLVATGFHRPTITDELRAKLGDEDDVRRLTRRGARNGSWDCRPGREGHGYPERHFGHSSGLAKVRRRSWKSGMHDVLHPVAPSGNDGLGLQGAALHFK